MEVQKRTDGVLFYKVMEPDSALAGSLFPTLILVHGRGSNEDDLLGLAPHLDPRFHFVSVRAPFLFPYGGFMWYDSSVIGKPEPKQFFESLNLLTTFIEDLPKKHPVDPKRIFLFGFSMGSIMSLATALTRPELVRAVVAHSGYVPEAEKLNYRWSGQQQTEYFLAHGTEDPVIPVHFGRRSDELMKKTNAKYIYKEYPIGHTISDESLADISRWLSERLDTQ